jgi:BMFP domain-containing protein YqiC
MDQEFVMTQVGDIELARRFALAQLIEAREKIAELEARISELEERVERD